MQKKVIIGLAAFALASGLAQAQTKLKFAHVYETSEPYHTSAVWAAGEIAKRTNNRYVVEVFPASTLGKETDINQGLTLGTVDIIYTGQLFAGRDLRTDRDRRCAVHVPRLQPLEGVLGEPAVRGTVRGLPRQERRQQGRRDHLLRRAPRHVEQAD